MSIMTTQDLVEIEVFRSDSADGTDFLEFRDTTVPKDDPLASYALALPKHERLRLASLLLEASR